MGLTISIVTNIIQAAATLAVMATLEWRLTILAVAVQGRVRFLAKKALFDQAVFGWVLRVFGHAAIDRSNARAALKSLNEVYARIQECPASFALFPEGTRSQDGTIHEFKPGVGMIAVDTNILLGGGRDEDDPAAVEITVGVRRLTPALLDTAEIADARREDEVVGATSVVPAVTAVLVDGIAGLRHKAVNDAVEGGVIVEALAGQEASLQLRDRRVVLDDQHRRPLRRHGIRDRWELNHGEGPHRRHEREDVDDGHDALDDQGY